MFKISTFRDFIFNFIHIMRAMLHFTQNKTMIIKLQSL